MAIGMYAIPRRNRNRHQPLFCHSFPTRTQTGKLSLVFFRIVLALEASYSSFGRDFRIGWRVYFRITEDHSKNRREISCDR